MANPTPEQIRQLSEQAVDFVPENARSRPSTFLSLAPQTSDSYPRSQRIKQPLTAEALAEATKQDGANANAIMRRASSLSSDGSKLRFLKLGPVHWGEHQDDHQADFYEVAVE
ncbi:2bec0137-002b-4531-8bc6-4dde0b48fe89 [Thermothielavioides terrestris]|uniref:Uncharacterized protein n=2 Tax=Thermothielavioides terrestris TaxID=2587410 RepID=G2RET9_THETT|nr:uncharacterized protein THITE_2171257 [Thermothielavioides terrestris NRRL 8126]AEO70222.1 hypothetical protein THITE_2171257 [Thermothielavioides terrestris NRRL 8126]SPQ18023.1 2bec0137-002b-4531-8bc6-4dde0b48fe89 [Thermothielavioides terrestris]